MRYAFLLGAPRSGTTWLQQLLAVHPSIATPQETHVFADFLVPLLRQWDARACRVSEVVADLCADRPPRDRLIGLPVLLESEEFESYARELLGRVAEKVRSAQPEASLLLEKTPSNALHVREIDRLVPAAAYIHLVRDPVDVCRSLLQAGSAWGQDWAPRSVLHAAREWKRHVVGARRAAAYERRYLEVRYEQLRLDPAGVLKTALGFLGVTSTTSDCEEMVETVARQQQQGSAETFYAASASVRTRLGATRVVEPPGFISRSPRPLTTRQVLLVESVTAALRAELGYPNRLRASDVGSRAVAMARATRAVAGAARGRG